MKFNAEYNEKGYGNITVKITIENDFHASRRHALEFMDKIREFVKGL